MAPLSFLVGNLACPVCGGEHAFSIQTAIADRRGEVGSAEYGVGDRVPLVNLHASGFFEVRSLDVDEPVRILEDGTDCEGIPLFVVVSLDRLNVIVGLELVMCSLSTLAYVHYLPPLHSVFWSWAGSLADPSDWRNEDRLWTDDRVRRLRLVLMLREVLSARTFHEAELFIDLIGCIRETPFRLEGDVWRVECRWGPNAEDRIGLAFSIDDPQMTGAVAAALPGGPSRILPADVFRRKCDQQAASVPACPSDLEADPERFAEARRALMNAVTYLEQLRYYIPDGEELVPLDALWGDQPRAEREAWPERYARSRIEATLARWRAELEVFGEPVLLDARSAEEAYVFMAIHPCPRCGTDTPRLQSRLEASGADLISVYAGECPICELPRRFAFRLPEMPVFQSGDGIELGPERSTCLDPGQLLLAADQFAQEAGDDVDDAALQRLELSIACLDEILKWIPESGRVPEEVITSRIGWAVYEQEPGRFEASRLRAVRETYRGIVDAALAGESR